MFTIVLQIFFVWKWIIIEQGTRPKDPQRNENQFHKDNDHKDSLLTAPFFRVHFSPLLKTLHWDRINHWYMALNEAKCRLIGNSVCLLWKLQLVLGFYNLPCMVHMLKKWQLSPDCEWPRTSLDKTWPLPRVLSEQYEHIEHILVISMQMQEVDSLVYNVTEFQ